MDRRSFLSTALRGGALAMTIVSYPGATAVSLQSPEIARPSRGQVKSHMLNMLDAFADRFSIRDVWFISGEPRDQSQIGLLEEKAKAMQMKMRQGLRDYAGVHEIVGQMNRAFHNDMLLVRLGAGGELFALTNTRTTETTLYVCLYGRHLQELPYIKGHGAAFFYAHDTLNGALFVPALALTDAWFCAVNIHEMGHALFDKVQKQPSARAPMWSPLWMQEEVMMHQVQTLVLDAATSGKYQNMIRQVVRGHKDAHTLEQFLLSLSVADIQTLDAVFPEKGTGKEFELRSAMYFTNLSFEWAKGAEVDLISIYSYLAKMFM